MFSSDVTIPVVNEDSKGHGDHDEDTDGDDDGGQVVDDDLGVWQGGDGGVGEAAAVAVVQDVFADGVGVVNITGQLATVHYLGLVSRHPGSDKRGLK